MGHTWREVDPGGAALQDSKMDRIRKIKGGLGNMSLSEFTVNELEAVMRLMSLFYNSAGMGDPYESHLKILEEKIESISQRNQPPAPAKPVSS
jgi:hypothetical protein